MVSPRSEPGLPGQFYTGSHSSPAAARLYPLGSNVVLKTRDDSFVVNWKDVDVAPRIGNAPRYLYLPGDQVFETADNDGVDRLTRQFRGGATNRFIHSLENHLGLILVAALVTVAVTVLTFSHGIPLSARLIAHGIPHHIHQQLGQGTLTQLDRAWLEPSELAATEQKRLQAVFAPILALEPEHPFQVVFRSGEWIGANALALPDGTLIFTDELVHLAQHDLELVSILAHEMGHVVYRHGMQGVIQTSVTTWLIVMMTGDLSAASDMSVAAPAILMNLAYSRGMEQDADNYALDLMQREGLEPVHFANIMRRMASAYDEDPEGQHDHDNSGWGRSLGAFLSSHPVTGDRIRQFEEAAAP
ncbi:M48 family metallopeptidase [uncultured Marinobacter sp.]|uniref:M48 family metallopeptidase n=1 Tax=uncultured Marinobacter sp. TaxID=187379 RepID=UPI0030DBACDF